MPIPDRTGKGDYHYHVFDYPGSQAFEPKKTYEQADVTAWLNSFPGHGLHGGAETRLYRMRAKAGKRTKAKFRVCRTLGAFNSKQTGFKRYSMIKDMDGLRTQAHATLNASLWSANQRTYFGRKIYILKFGIPDNEVDNEHPQILLTGGVHGREWISSEIPYLIAEYLIKNYDPAAPPGPQQTIKELLERFQFWVIPMLNPDGHCWSAVKERLWRRNRKRWSHTSLHGANAAVYAPYAGDKNALFDGGGAAPPAPFLLNPRYIESAEKIGDRALQAQVAESVGGEWVFMGVDCNRNFAGAHNPEYDPREELFSGPQPMSEQETQALDDCFNGTLTFEPLPAAPAVPQLNHLAASVDYHSAKGAIMCDDGASGGAVDSRAARKVGLCMEQHINRYGDGAEYDFGTTKTIVDSESGGSVMHHCYTNIRGRGRIPLAFTIELDPVRDKTKGRWSPSRKDIRRVFEKNLTAVLCLIHHAKEAGGNPYDVARHSQNVIGQRSCRFKKWPDKVKKRGNQPPRA